MKFLITGVGSVMGHSILDALVPTLDHTSEVYLTNSESGSAAEIWSKQHLSNSHFSLSPLAASDDYENFVREFVSLRQIDLVFPGTQHELQKLSRLRDEGLPIASPSESIVNLCSDKLALAGFFADTGLAHPKTRSAVGFHPEKGCRYVAKPRRGSASRGFFLVESGSWPSVFEQIEQPSSYIVQEFLDGEEFTCSLYKDLISGEIHKLVLSRTLSPDGASISGEVVRHPAIENYLSCISDQLAEVGWDYGNLNVQLRLTESGPRVLEINPRLSSTESPKAKFGFNTCKAFVDNVVLGKTCSLQVVPAGLKFRRYYQEVIFE